MTLEQHAKNESDAMNNKGDITQNEENQPFWAPHGVKSRSKVTIINRVHVKVIFKQHVKYESPVSNTFA